MDYNYDDTFLSNLVTDEELQNIENSAKSEVNKLNISDSFYFEKLTIAKVYISIAKMNFEDETVQKKHTLYKKEFEEYFNIAKNTTSIRPFNIPIGR